MNPKRSKNELKKLVENNKLKEIISILVEISEGDIELQNTIILITAQYKDLKQKRMVGLISENEASVEVQKIRKSIIELIDDLDENLFYNKKINPSHSKEDKESVWLLIEDGPGFLTKLRTTLYNKLTKSDFQIKDYFREGKSYFKNYENALDLYFFGFQQFLSDKNAKWLLTVFPEEERSSSLFKKGERILKDLAKKNKHMICFESGYNLKEKINSISESLKKNNFDSEESNYVYKNLQIIDSDHEKSMYDLIKVLLKFLEKEERVHLVIVPGPKMNPIANKRLKIKLEFVAAMLSEQINPHINLIPSLEFESKIKSQIQSLNRHKSIESFHISTPYFNSWDRFEAKNKINEIISFLNTKDKNVHTCFLCINDDVALGIKDALEESQKNDEEKYSNVSLFGFDGITEMKNYLSNGGVGGTMEVNIDYFCDLAMEFISKNDLDTMGHFSIPARRIISNH